MRNHYILFELNLNVINIHFSYRVAYLNFFHFNKSLQINNINPRLGKGHPTPKLCVITESSRKLMYRPTGMDVYCSRFPKIFWIPSWHSDSFPLYWWVCYHLKVESPEMLSPRFPKARQPWAPVQIMDEERSNTETVLGGRLLTSPTGEEDCLATFSWTQLGWFAGQWWQGHFL